MRASSLLSLIAAGVLLTSASPRALFTRDGKKLSPDLMSSEPGNLMPQGATSLCRKDEQVLFSCNTAAAKMISLCGSKELEKKKGYLQYRFGKVGALELEFPQKLQDTQAAFRIDHYFRARVDRTHLSFVNGGYKYELYYYYEGDVSPEIITGGVTVGKVGDELVYVQRKCRGRIVSGLGALESVVPAVEDSELNPQ
jgi:hypothetical protein